MTEQRHTRVCQILYSGLGGHGSVVFSLLSADKEKFFQHSLVFYGIEMVRERYVRDAGKLDVPFTAIRKKRGPDLLSWIRVYKALKKQSPDVVLMHSASLIFPVMWYCRRKGARLIAVEHTSNAVKRKSEHLFSLWCRRFADKVVLLSEVYKKEYLLRYGWKDERKLVVIGNGIDIGFYRPRERNGSDKTISFAMVGRFTPQKNQLELIKAIQKTGRENVLLQLAGSGKMLETCKAYINENGLGDKVKLPGLLNDEEIATLLANSDVYVHASTGETMPTAIMQAMACGLAVLGSDVTGINNLIRQNEDGLLFPVENIDVLAGILTSLIDNESLRKELGLKARQRALRDFSHLRMFEQYKEIISG